jgi:hypothetical protein
MEHHQQRLDDRKFLDVSLRPGLTRVACDLEVTLPLGATIKGRGSSVDYDVTDVTGSVDISSGNAGVRLTNIGGNAKVDLQRSDIVR